MDYPSPSFYSLSAFSTSIIIISYFPDTSSDRVSEDPFRHISYTPGTVLILGSRGHDTSKAAPGKERGLFDVFLVSPHVMTIEVPVGLRSWLCLIVLCLGFFFFSLECFAHSPFFTFLILSLDLGVTCAFLDTNGLCDDSMRAFLSFLPCDSRPLHCFFTFDSSWAACRLDLLLPALIYFLILFPASITMRGSNFFTLKACRFVCLSPAFCYSPPSAGLFISLGL